MADELGQIKTLVDDKAEELGHESPELIEFITTLELDQPGMVNLGEYEHEQARWGTRKWVVYQLPNRSIVGVQYYEGAEMQESFYEGRVAKLEKHQVTTITYREQE